MPLPVAKLHRRKDSSIYVCACQGKGKETLRRRTGAMIKSFFILAFECLVFDAGFKKAPPTQTSLMNREFVPQVGRTG